MSLRYGSVCSGIEAATVAWHPLGWRAVFYSEIEPFPSAVLSHHYPDTPNLGDMTKFNSWPDYAIDLLVGGTPCQSFSVAGLRGGLDDPRGNLMLTFGAIAAKYRPRWLVWENVPGVLSSNGGKDFASFLGLITGQRIDPPEGGWRNSGVASGIDSAYGAAYRVLDAQYVRVESHPRAVPQRRRRVFVVGHLGDWRRAAAVLFERESLCGHPAPRREARERIAHATAGSLTSSGRGVERNGDSRGQDPVVAELRGGHPEVAWALQERDAKGADSSTKEGHLIVTPQGGFFDEAKTFQESGHGWWNDAPAAQSLRDASLGGGSHANLVAHSLKADGFDASEDGTGRGTPLVAFSCKDHGADAGDVSPTLRGMGHDESHANGGGQLAIAFDTTQVTSVANYSNPQPGDPCHPLASKAHPPAIAIQERAVSENLEHGPQGKGFQEDHAYTLEARNKVQAVAFQTRIARNGRGQPEDICPALNGSDAGATSDMRPVVATSGPAYAVRRLVCEECEALQGFPRNYTRIPWRGRSAAECPDGPRYKALGNSMATNVMRWIGERIDLMEQLIAEGVAA